MRKILVIGLFGHFQKKRLLSFPSVFESPNQPCERGGGGGGMKKGEGGMSKGFT